MAWMDGVTADAVLATGSARHAPVPLACPPRWGTPRTESRPTYGPRLAQVSAELGTRFMPWQRHVADVSHEVDPATGLLWYRQVVVEIPRQSGKTTLGLTVRVHRSIGPFGGPQMLLYTAQTRNDARQKWEDEHTPVLQASPFWPLVKPRKRTGAEAFLWANGSIDGLPAPTKKTGHGKTLDLGFIDEAFAQVDDRLEQAFEPAMVTRPQPQLWVVSTAGTAESVYLRNKVKAGRRQVESGEPSRTAFFEWSAPNNADPMDPATWWACMPALGYTISEATIQATLQKSIDEHGVEGLQLFRRAYLNQWVDEFASIGKVPAAAWARLADGDSQIEGRPVFAIEASQDRATVSIVAAGRRADGLAHVELIDDRPGAGLGWVVERAVELRRNDPVAWIVDPTGPAGPLIADLEACGVELTEVTGRGYVQACGEFYDAVISSTLRHRGQPQLDDAVRAARSRNVGDGGWAWARRDSPVDIARVIGATLALHGLLVHGSAGPTLWM